MYVKFWVQEFELLINQYSFFKAFHFLSSTISEIFFTQKMKCILWELINLKSLDAAAFSR